jgi:hypothetical protein
MPQFKRYDWLEDERPFTIGLPSATGAASEQVDTEFPDSPVGRVIIPLAFCAFWAGVSLIAGYLILNHAESVRAAEVLPNMFD